MKSSLSKSEQQALLANIQQDAYPDERGRFGPFGGRYVPETLVPALDRLQAGVDRYLRDPDFLREFHDELHNWVGRATPLTFARDAVETVGRGDLAEARRSRTHRRA